LIDLHGREETAENNAGVALAGLNRVLWQALAQAWDQLCNTLALKRNFDSQQTFPPQAILQVSFAVRLYAANQARHGVI
jgi:hypothetical protein